MKKSAAGFNPSSTYKLMLQVSDPRAGDEDVECTVSVDVLKDDEPAEGIGVQFSRDNQGWSDTVETESDGRVAKDFKHLKPGGHLFEVRLADDTSIRKSKKIKVEGAMASKIGRPIVRAEGDDGDYMISVSVPRPDGASPATNVPVRLMISPLGGRVHIEDLRTNKDGLLVDKNGEAGYHLKFKESECDVTVQVYGYMERIQNLQGPAQKRQTKKLNPPPNIQEMSWPELVKSAIESGRKARRKS